MLAPYKALKAKYEETAADAPTAKPQRVLSRSACGEWRCDEVDMHRLRDTFEIVLNIMRG